MILQELCRLYDRLEADSNEDIPKMGFVNQGIAFAVVIDEHGNLMGIDDLRYPEGKTLRNKMMTLPGKAKPPGSGINPSLHGWDRTDYMLGYLDLESIADQEREKINKRCQTAHQAFRESVFASEKEIGNADYSAFCRFLEAWTPDDAINHPLLKDVSGKFGVVRISGYKPRYLHELSALSQTPESSDEVIGTCLVTGETEALAKTHDPKIKNINGAQPAGASIVSFNLSSFESYGRTQSYNAPVGVTSAFKYSTVLNKLLERSSERRIQIGDTTCVFWADSPSPAEQLFFVGVTGGPAEDSDTVKSVRSALKSLVSGVGKIPDAETGFHILGLSPNAARLSIRFWFSGTFGEMIERVIKHQKELSIIRKDSDRDILPVWFLLAQTAREAKDIPPLLGGALLRSILTGAPYPHAFFSAVMRRIRADRDIKHPRAAIIKAILMRNYGKENLEMLNPEREEVAYQLGRLFASLEKTQTDALGSINASIKDRYFGAASATPGVVFPRLIRMSQHHIGKLEGGRKVVAERRIQEICGHIQDFPGHLNLADQGLFTLGYYHQREDLYTKKTEVASAAEESTQATE